MLGTLTAKGQITLPKVFRNKLGLHAGDKLTFVMLENGVLQIVPLKQPSRKLKGLIPKPKKAVTIEEMNDAISQSINNQ